MIFFCIIKIDELFSDPFVNGEIVASTGFAA